MVHAMAEESTQTVTTADGPMEIHDVTPDAKPSGAVIVIQEAFGVNDYVRDVTGRFAAAGYRAVAPTMFHRAGGGTAPYDDFSKVMPLFKGVTDDAILMDVDATTAYLRKAGFDDRSIGIALERFVGEGVDDVGLDAHSTISKSQYSKRPSRSTRSPVTTAIDSANSGPLTTQV